MTGSSGIVYYKELIQGSDEWLQARCGILTASEMKLILTPTLKAASNDKERSHLYELMAQRITDYVEPHYISADMLRGQEDEIYARAAYEANYAPVSNVGFITNDAWGFTIGYSPDGTINDEGLIEIKSRRQKYQIETIISQQVPDEYILQLQTGLLVTRRKWIDFISYCGGLPMVTIRVYPDEKIQEAIISAATSFEKRLSEKMAIFQDVLKSKARLVPTERRIQEEIFV